MCGILKGCDIVVNPIVGSSAATIINKHGDYAASGKPVLNTQDSDEYRMLVNEYRMGFNCRNGDAADLAEKLGRLADDPELREEMGRNARRCAEEKFDRAGTYRRLAEAILNGSED
jgi:glycosyltransferase involved in cell wall biosynthesis